MHRLLEFIKRIYVVILFLLFEGVALWCYATSTPYTEAKILSRTTAVGGAISGMVTDVVHFFSLPENNRVLTERVAELEQELEHEQQLLASAGIDAMSFDVEEDARFCYHAARVVSMTLDRQRNYIVLDKGADHGIAADMCVITPDRKLVGYVVSATENYSIAMSLLNSRFTIGGRLVDNGYVCSVSWPADSRYELEATEISVYATPTVGMTVNVSSERLPEGIAIGTIESVQLNTARTAYSARLAIAANMATIDNVLIVENKHSGELEELIESVE